MRAVTAFLSFRREDAAACTRFRRRYEPVAGLTFAVHPFAYGVADWKTPCRAMIERSDGVVVLIGATTAESASVRWEIDIAGRCGKRVLGVLLPGGRPSVPALLPPTMIVPWADSRIPTELASWSPAAGPETAGSPPHGCQPSATTAAMIAASP